MKIKNSFLLLFAFIFSLLLVDRMVYVISWTLENVQEKQTKAMHDELKGRLRSFLNTPISIGLLAADSFSKVIPPQEEYVQYAWRMMEANKELIGLNLLNAEGQIIRVFPPKANENAIKKVSQNYHHLFESYNKGETYWISLPFMLFQGKPGYAIYFPIKKNDNLVGWFATVINMEQFNKKFRPREYTKSYDLVIKSDASEVPYVATAVLDSENPKIFASELTINKRKFLIYSWPKQTQLFSLQWYWKFLLAIFLTVISKIVWTHFKRSKISKKQLRDINLLLQLTSNEAHHKLIEIQSSSISLPSQEEEILSYFSNLIEQIGLLQTMAISEDLPEEESLEIKNLIADELINYKGAIDKRKLNISIALDSDPNLTLLASGWLIQKSILSNILFHCIVYSKEASNIVIRFGREGSKTVMSFHIENLSEKFKSTTIKEDRRLDVARKALSIYKGELVMHNDQSAGKYITILL